ncbi:MAG: hypothetical protein ABJX82_18750, partial [Paracoccaceae bacterium]
VGDYTLVPRPSKILSRWEECYPNFRERERLGAIQRDSILCSGYPLSLVFGKISRDPKQTGNLELGRYRNLFFFARENWSCHYGQIVLIPADIVGFRDTKALTRSKTDENDLMQLLEIARVWGWPILTNVAKSGASVPERVHYQIYPPRSDNGPNFPLIERSLGSRTNLANFQRERFSVYELPLHPCPALLVEATGTVSDACVKTVCRISEFYLHGYGYNLFIRSRSKNHTNTTQLVFFPRNRTSDAGEYPAEEICTVSSDWKWGAPELCGCFHLRENGREIAELLKRCPKVIDISMKSVGGDMRAIREIVRWSKCFRD